MKQFILALTFVCGLGATVACPGPGPIPAVADAVVDCTIENQSLIGQLVDEFKVLIYGQSPDWSAIYQRAKHAGKSIGGCALAKVVNEYLGNKASPPSQQNSMSAFNTFEKFRKEEAGGASFKMEDGKY